MLVHSLNGHKDQEEPVTSLNLPWGCRAQALGHCLLLSQAHQQKMESEVEQPGFKQVPRWDTSIVEGDTTSVSPVPQIIVSYLFSNLAYG